MGIWWQPPISQCHQKHFGRTEVSDFNSTIWYGGDSDVVDIVKLVTLWWWLISDVGARIIKLATCSLCWWFSQCTKSVTNILTRSPTSETCHQNIWSPTSVTNIDVTDMAHMIWLMWYDPWYDPYHMTHLIWLNFTRRRDRSMWRSADTCFWTIQKA